MAQAPHRFEYHAQLNYLLYLPPDYNDATKYPLILFLHGSGERGGNIDLVKKHGLPRRLDQGEDIPFIVVSPQCPANESWDNHLHEVVALLDHIIASYSVQTDQVYLTGLSMGGFGTWLLSILYPHRFAAIAPICGGMPPILDMSQAAERIRHIPTWVFHGAQDDVVPANASRNIVAALKTAGGMVTYTEYPDLKHDSWTITYNNPELYTWFLKHRIQS